MSYRHLRIIGNLRPYEKKTGRVMILATIDSSEFGWREISTILGKRSGTPVSATPSLTEVGKINLTATAESFSRQAIKDLLTDLDGMMAQRERAKRRHEIASRRPQQFTNVPAHMRR